MKQSCWYVLENNGSLFAGWSGNLNARWTGNSAGDTLTPVLYPTYFAATKSRIELRNCYSLTGETKKESIIIRPVALGAPLNDM